MAWGTDGTPDTLGSAGDTVTIADLTSLKFNVMMAFLIQVTGNIRSATRVGNGSISSSTVYANRDSENGGADSTATSQSYMKNSGSNSFNGFVMQYSINIATEEKLFIAFYCGANAVGASNAPARMESVGKFVDTTNAYNQIQQYNDQAGDYDTDSNLSVLGTD